MSALLFACTLSLYILASVSGDSTSGKACATSSAAEYPCDTTDDCCSYWEAIYPGTDCEAACTEDAEGQCNYCYLTSSSTTTTTSSTTTAPSGACATGQAPEHEYPCDTTDDCCAYWHALFDTDCQAACTQHASGVCNYCYLTNSSASTTTTAAGSGCTQHEYPCDTTAECCSYWQTVFPGTECEAACTEDAADGCNYCYLTTSSTPIPVRSWLHSHSQSGSGCTQHDYPCETTADCCSFWEAHFPGTECQAACTEDPACNYCYLIESSSSASSTTGSASGCAPHEYPCETTADCCSYWDAHFPGTECEAECTEDAADGCNYCYLTSSSTPIPEQAKLNAYVMNGAASWLYRGDLMHSSFATLTVVILTAAVISALFICRNGVCRDQAAAKDKLLLQPHTQYGSV